MVSDHYLLKAPLVEVIQQAGQHTNTHTHTHRTALDVGKKPMGKRQGESLHGVLMGFIGSRTPKRSRDKDTEYEGVQV